MEILIRPFERTDVDPLYFLDQRCHPEGGRVAYHRWLSALLDPAVSALVVAEDTEARPQPLIGCLVVKAEPWRGVLNILALMVDTEYRRHGIAQRLLDRASGAARRLGLRELALLQESEEEGLLGFLESAGFSRTDELAPGLRHAEPKPLWSLSLGEADPPPELSTEPGGPP
jgi:ribosomal protein S18 acetylase RimI-like enzyme